MGISFFGFGKRVRFTGRDCTQIKMKNRKLKCCRRSRINELCIRLNCIHASMQSTCGQYAYFACLWYTQRELCYMPKQPYTRPNKTLFRTAWNLFFFMLPSSVHKVLSLIKTYYTMIFSNLFKRMYEYKLFNNLALTYNKSLACSFLTFSCIGPGLCIHWFNNEFVPVPLVPLLRSW